MRLLIILFLCQIGCLAQEIDTQTEILHRETAEDVKIVRSVREAQRIMSESRIDYVMITNASDVNTFYYENGELHVLRPQSTDIFLTERDHTGRVIKYPSFFFDRASYDKPIIFRIGICKNCRNSSIGIQYGLNSP